MKTKILIIGACGQIGTELTHKLREIYGINNVVASDIRKLNNDVVNNGIFEVVNALDYNQIQHLVEQYQITDVYLMAALLSATAEKNPAFAWDLNMNSLFHVLNLAKAGKIKKIFVIENRQVWGRIDKNSGEIFISPKQTHSHDDDILDDVCQLVLAKGGEVVVLKNADSVKGCVAAAIVTDKSHLYDFSGSYSISI